MSQRRSSHLPPFTWRCLACAATGSQPSRDEAATAFTAHWTAQHEEAQP